MLILLEIYEFFVALQMCGVDQGENGSWQGHAFPIMVIHFLQQKKVLPVLHDLIENPEGNPEIYLGNNSFY